MTSLHCVVQVSASYNIQVKNIYKIFSKQLFFSPVALWPDSGSWPPLMGLRNHPHLAHHTL